jgi:acetate kinase
MRVLTVNAGSSSLKLRLLDEPDEPAGDGPEPVLERADLPASGSGVEPADLDRVLAEWPTPDAVGHRVVHGGAEFADPVVLDAGVRRRLGELTDLAPLHQPKSLTALDAVSERLPDVPAVACFDTAFHAGMPAEAATYAVPAQWRTRWAIRRYGFHGLSHAYSAARAVQMLGSGPAGLRLVICHLGAGASLCAVRDGHSVDTTMGFTPLEGLVMATRSGSVDPGLVLWLEEHEHLSAGEIAEALERQSGLTGLAGTADMRAVLAGAAGGDEDARLALQVYLHRLAASIAAMAAAAGGLDALVFTGGVGEWSPEIRRLTAERLGWLGVGVDDDRNRAGGDGTDDFDITAALASGGPAQVRTLVVAAREDLQIARDTRQALAS